MFTVCGVGNVMKANTNNRQPQSEQQRTTHKHIQKQWTASFGCIATFLIIQCMNYFRGLKFQYVI